MSTLDDIRAACAVVADRATRVRIDERRLDEYAGELDLRLAVATAQVDDPSRIPFDDVEATTAHVIALDAVNFGSGWFPVLRKRDGLSGYFTIATSWREHCERHGPPTAEWLAGATTERCAEIFGQDGEALELMALFAESWRQTGELLLDRYDGSFRALVDAADRSAATLLDLLRVAPRWDDRRRYGDLDVPFHKRAQITSVDLAAAGAAAFDDLDDLTIFADNLVPHVLRVDRVLRLDDELADHIDRGELLVEGSDDEVELRATAVHAVELLATRTGKTAADLDNLLWNRGQGAAYKSVPRPRCRTSSY
ncbi:MAG TPA: queuosine salvage family protein [Acidimicrobiales bacterium]|nr:queuosine salvage family protein [Acidimicrobiales bacterium]